jgi:hypothetical protein
MAVYSVIPLRVMDVALCQNTLPVIQIRAISFLKVDFVPENRCSRMSESPMRKTLRTKERPEFQNKRSTTV